MSIKGGQKQTLTCIGILFLHWLLCRYSGQITRNRKNSGQYKVIHVLEGVLTQGGKHWYGERDWQTVQGVLSKVLNHSGLVLITLLIGPTSHECWTICGQRCWWEMGKGERKEKSESERLFHWYVTKSYDNFQTITGTGKQPQVISEKIMDNYWFSIAA